VSITHKQATAIVAAALDQGRVIECHPLTVAVLDPGGHLVSFGREDGSGIARPQIAFGKAWGALGMGFGTREFVRRAEVMPMFVGALSAAFEGRMIPVAGGVLVRDAEARLLGAVGISGDTSERDEQCAVHGIRSVGLRPDTGASEG